MSYNITIYISKRMTLSPF